MSKELFAKATIFIKAPITKVWDALVDPTMIKQFMFGAEVISDWTEGSPIIWKGIWKDKPYEDKGVILQFQPPHLLQYTHYSPLSGQPETLENYHTLTYELADQDGGTELSLSQDGNKTEEEKKHSEQMWESMLQGIQKLLEVGQ